MLNPTDCICAEQDRYKIKKTLQDRGYVMQTIVPTMH